MRFKQLTEQILSGLAKGKTIEDIAKKHGVDIDKIKEQLNDGIDVETNEHVKKERNLPKMDRETAKKIAMDHLFEDPEYYTKLREMEKKAN